MDPCTSTLLTTWSTGSTQLSNALTAHNPCGKFTVPSHSSCRRSQLYKPHITHRILHGSVLNFRGSCGYAGNQSPRSALCHIDDHTAVHLGNYQAETAPLHLYGRLLRRMKVRSLMLQTSDILTLQESENAVLNMEPGLNYSQPVAIVGIGLRLPGGCHDAASFWNLLVNKRDARSPIPPERFDIEGFRGSKTNGNRNLQMRHGYFLEEPIDRFDAAFFSMSRAEVDRLDPQQRLLLEVVYEALENGGETDWRGKNIAVYASSFGSDWLKMQSRDPQDGGVYQFTGNDDFVLSNRVSYEFDLHGPSMTIKTGCSSSMVSLHLACEALQRGECSAAVVGASNLLLSPENFMELQHVLAPDGSSKSFDANANGYARAESVNAVYIKRLEDAIRDGNPIRAVIRATAVNSDGKTRGFFNPSLDAQITLMRRAYQKAGIDNPEETPLVECHGTGTAAGDPLEAAAVAAVFGEGGTYITSVKPNIGHAEAAAGLNSIIKAVLALEHKVIPPNIKFHTPNPKILFTDWNLRVPTEVTPWPSGRLQRISINSFGLGGTNAHAILDSADLLCAAYSGHKLRESRMLLINGSHLSNGTADNSHLSNSFDRLQNGHSLRPFQDDNGSELQDLSTPHSEHLIVVNDVVNGSRKSKTDSMHIETVDDHQALQPGDSEPMTENRPSKNYSNVPHTLYASKGQECHNIGSQRSGDRSPRQPDGTIFANLKQSDETQRLLVFSAHNESSLQKAITSFNDFMARESFQLSDLAYTLSVRRQHQNVRSFCISDGKTLRAIAPVKTRKTKSLLFIFTGQGAQWPGMGRELLRDFPAFRADIRKMDTWLAESSHPPRWQIEDLLQNASPIDAAVISQPLCTAIQIGLINLFRQWNILPTAVVGHSSGEIAAAYAANAFEMREALLIAHYRGVATAELHQAGAMAAVGLSRADLIDLLVGNTRVACENSPSSVTISGDMLDVEATLDRILQTRPGVFARKLKVDRAYHSDHMQEVSQYYKDLMSTIIPRSGPLTVPMYSSVTGTVIYDSASLGSSYWGSNMENTVLFSTAITRALHARDDYSVAVEVGPHSTLSGPMRQICQVLGRKIEYISLLSRGAHSTTTILTALGHLYCHGLVPRFDVLYPSGVTMSDLPPYPWNHTTSYWHENRISRNFRTRQFAEHELLGARVVGDDDLEPSWRKLLDISNSPWLGDHKIAGQVVFPAAGYISMIGEAIRQLSRSTSFFIRQLSLETTMVIPSAQQTEIVTKLRPYRIRRKVQSLPCFDFEVFSYDGNKWISHCTGRVHAAHEPSQNLAPLDAKETKDLEASEWYRISRQVGLQWGDAFQALHNIQCAVAQRAVTAGVNDQSLPRNSTYALHPIIIDQIFQCCVIGNVQGQFQAMQKLSLPVYIGKIHIVAQPSLEDLQIHAQITSHSAAAFSASGQVQAKDGSIVLRSDDVEFRTLSNATTAAVEDAATQKVRVVEWRPSIDFMDAEKLIHPTADLTSCITLLEKLNILCSIETVNTLQSAESSKHHLMRFKQWNEQYSANVKCHGSAIVANAQSLVEMTSEKRHVLIQSLLAECMQTPAKDIAVALVRIFHAAEDIFYERIEPLEPLIADGLLARIYNFFNLLEHQQFFRLLGHGKPNMRILEVGAGTGGFTSTVLSALHDDHENSLFSCYTYTDTSPGFFKAAKERFSNYVNLEFTKLDITQDPAAQGVQPNSYDLVVAANVLHATPDLQKTLTNCRSLLGPEGRLVLMEMCSMAKYMNYIMGVLPGWWLGEADDRRDEPYIQPAQWDVVLRRAGFDGIEASILDQTPPYQLDAMIIARVVQPVLPPRKEIRFLLSDPDAVSEKVKSIRKAFQSEGYEVSLCSLEEPFTTGTNMLSLLDIDGVNPFFEDFNGPHLQTVVDLIRDCHSCDGRILWLTKPAQISCQDPYQALILGIARMLRFESGPTFATLELDVDGRDRLCQESIVRVFENLHAKPSVDCRGIDCEYAMVGGDVCIPRFITRRVETLLCQSVDPTQAFRKFGVTSPGLSTHLRWSVQSWGTLENDEVEIVVRSVSLSAWDVKIAMGIAISEEGLGLEGVGVVSRLGPNVKVDLQVGNSVMFWSPSSLATHIRVRSSYCAKMPASVPPVQAVASLTSYMAAIRGLEEVCSVSQGERVLIHSAASVERIAALQIARLLKAEVYVTVSNDDEKTFLRTQYAISPSHIFSLNDQSFVYDILNSTDSRGVDIVLNLFPGDSSSELRNCLAEGGCMVEIRHGKFSYGGLDCQMLRENQHFHTFDMVTLLQQKPKMVQRLLRKTIDLYSKGLIQPALPTFRYRPVEVEEAILQLQNNDHIGALCIDFPHESTEIESEAFADTKRLDSDRAYLLVGGFEDLIESAAIWLAEKGAGAIMILLESASHRVVNTDLNHALEVLGCGLQILSGNCADNLTLQNFLTSAVKPIAGMIHLPQSLAQDLQSSERSTIMFPTDEIKSMWNLHRAFERNSLNFFVLISYVCGARDDKQDYPSHTAAKAFKEAFVHFRRGLNLPASSMDLGVIPAPSLDESDNLTNTPDVGRFRQLLDLCLESSRLTVEKMPTDTLSFINRAQFEVGELVKQLPRDAYVEGSEHKLTTSNIADPLHGTQSNLSSKPAKSMLQFMEEAQRNPDVLSKDILGTESFLTSQIFEVLRGLVIFEGDVDPDDPTVLSDLNIDSLMAIELQDWWRLSMGTKISVLELTSIASLTELARLARERLCGGFKKC